MKLKVFVLVMIGVAGLLLWGCASPRGGADEPTEQQQEQSMVYTNEGTTPAPMSTPSSPAFSGSNPRDLRDPQALTIPGPPISPRP